MTKTTYSSFEPAKEDVSVLSDMMIGFMSMGV